MCAEVICPRCGGKATLEDGVIRCKCKPTPARFPEPNPDTTIFHCEGEVPPSETARPTITPICPRCEVPAVVANGLITCPKCGLKGNLRPTDPTDAGHPLSQVDVNSPLDLCPKCGVKCILEEGRAPKCPKCGATNFLEWDPFDGLPFQYHPDDTNPIPKRLVINKSWILEEGMQRPRYDPTIWGNRHPDFARKKMEQVEENIDDGLLYPPILETLAKTLKPGEKVLDIGCAGGHFYREMLKWVGKGIDYTGVDITEKYIKFAREKFPDKQWFVGDARKLPFPDKYFDHSLCLFVLVHLDQDGMKQTLNELARVTKKQMLFAGYFSVTRICGHQLSGECQCKSDFIYDIIDLKEMMLKGWSLEALTEDPKLLHLPVSVQDSDDKWIELEADVPVISYVRMVRE